MCAMAVAGDQELRDHLADVHDLADDPGTESTVDGLRPIILESSRGDGPLFGGSVAVQPARIYDRSSEDARWHPISVGVGGLILTGLVAAILLIL